jgi:hypothetical protein
MPNNGIHKYQPTDNGYGAINAIVAKSIIDKSKLPVIFGTNRSFVKTASAAAAAAAAPQAAAALGPITLREWLARTVGQGTLRGVVTGIGLPIAAAITLWGLLKAISGRVADVGSKVYRVGKQVFLEDNTKPSGLAGILSSIGPGDVLGAAGLGLALYNIVKKYKEKEKKPGEKTDILKDYWPALLGLGAAGLGFWPRISELIGPANPPKK